MNGLSNDQSVVAYAGNKASDQILLSNLEYGTRMFLLESLSNAFEWYELNSAWAIHEAGYKIAGSKSEKGKNKTWVTIQAQAIQSSVEPAKKFRNQLDTLFRTEKIDLEFVHQRVDAAYSYFFKILDSVLTSNLKKIAELSRIKKTKQYIDELTELDELLTSAILKMKKVRLLIEAVSNGREITKEVVWSNEIRNYKVSKISSVQQEMRQNPTTLAMDDDFEDVLQLKLKKKVVKEKKEKINTYDLTYSLLREGNSIEEIAKIRQLSPQTINNHFVHLIKAEKVELRELMDEKRIQELASYFDDYTETSLSPLKERLGNKVTWDELKLYQASTLI
jgi:uncharacterized protein YpbB